MELWEKQYAYISRRFVVVEMVELAQLDHLSWPEVPPGGCGAG
jgi:hypothetical protein